MVTRARSAWEAAPPMQMLKESLQEQVGPVLSWVGGIAASVLVINGGMWIAGSFMNITFTGVAYMGFLGGLCTGAVTAAMFYVARKSVQVRPEKIFRKAITALKNDDRVAVRWVGEALWCSCVLFWVG